MTKRTLESVLSRDLAYIVLAIEAWRRQWAKKGK